MTITLKALQSEWYARLEASGFVDIEDCANPNRPLKSFHKISFRHSHLRRSQPRWVESADQYYYDAKELLMTYAFKNDLHRFIWELHCEGLNKRKIEDKICLLTKTYKREQIGNIIKAIAVEIKL